MFPNFSYELKLILNNSKYEMKELKHSYIGSEHVILAILKNNNNICRLLNNYGVNYENFKKKVISVLGIGNNQLDLFIFTPLLKNVMENLLLYSQDRNNCEINLNHFFCSLIEQGEGVAFRLFNDYKIDLEELYDEVSSYSVNSFQSSILEEIAVNLNNEINSSMYDPVIGRDSEVLKLMQIILRKNKGNPLLVGPAGVGKTAIVEEFVRKIVNKEVPLRLQGKIVYSLSMSSLVSGTKYRGEFEEKLLNIINELEKRKNIILFIDEIHTLVGAGGADGAIDASNILKPALSRGKINIIGATTIEEYNKYFEDDSALSRRFQKILVREPNEKELYKILSNLKSNYEIFHKVTISDSILKYIIKVSNRFMIDRKNPDRSIDLLDESCSFLSSQMNTLEKRNFTLNNKLLKIKNEKKKLLNNNKYDLALNFLKEEHRIESEINNNSFKIVNHNSKNKLLTEEIVNYVIEGKYYINIFEKNNIKKEKLFNSYKNVLKRKIINQDSVIDSFIDSIKYFYSIDYCEDKPFSFLFVGSNGVGKNTLANEIGKLLFNNVIKINFNEFVDEQSINKILGSSSGYVGYDNKKNLFESMKENPSSLIIMEDFDVACDSVKNLFYQILSKGYINESNGHKVIFNNCIFIIIKDTYDSINVGFDNSNNEDSICYKDKVDFILNFNKLNKSDIISILNNKIKGKKITISNMLLDKLIMESDYVKNGASKLDSLLDKYFYKVKI